MKKRFENYTDSDLLSFLDKWDSVDKDIIFQVLYEIKNRQIRLSYIEMNIFKKIIQFYILDERFQLLLNTNSTTPQNPHSTSSLAIEMQNNNVEKNSIYVDYSRINAAGRHFKTIAITTIIPPVLLFVITFFNMGSTMKAAAGLILLIIVPINISMLFMAGSELSKCGQEEYDSFR